MHISILCLGSHGDVQPFVTLGTALQRAGQNVRLITAENFRTMVEAQQLDFHPIRIDTEAILTVGAGQAIASVGTNLIRAVYAAYRSFGAEAEQYVADLSNPKLLETDALINQMPGSLYGLDLAEKAGIPHIVGAVIPMTPTSEFPQIGFSTILNTLPIYNKFTYWISEQVVWQLFRRSINSWRTRTLDLPKRSIWGYSSALRRSDTPILNGFSQHVVPQPADWGKRVHVTGYWFPPAEAWEPGDRLQKFIGAGERTIFVGFGSMPIGDPQRTIEVIAKALKKLGLRGILSSGWKSFSESKLPDHMIQIGYAPYEHLFPRMAAVIHHGGSGTTGAGLRAGVPTILTPFAFDQFYWGKRLVSLGVSPGFIPYSDLSVDRLVAVLDQALHDHRMKKKCEGLAMKIQKEAGVQGAVDATLDYLETNSPGERQRSNRD
jgi:sterol 3beta-glucosyltransferase